MIHSEFFLVSHTLQRYTERKDWKKILLSRFYKHQFLKNWFSFPSTSSWILRIVFPVFSQTENFDLILKQKNELTSHEITWIWILEKYLFRQKYIFFFSSLLESGQYRTCIVVVIVHCPRRAVWDKENSCKTMPRFPVDSHQSTIFPLGSCMRQRQIHQTLPRRDNGHKNNLSGLCWDGSPPARTPWLSRWTGDCPAAQKPLWLSRCPQVGSVTCQFGWGSRHSSGCISGW